MLPTSNLTVDYLSRRGIITKWSTDTIEEEAPANNVGAGNVAGANGDPVVKPKNKYKKKNELDTTSLLRRIPLKSK